MKKTLLKLVTFCLLLALVFSCSNDQKKNPNSQAQNIQNPSVYIPNAQDVKQPTKAQAQNLMQIAENAGNDIAQFAMQPSTINSIANDVTTLFNKNSEDVSITAQMKNNIISAEIKSKSESTHNYSESITVDTKQGTTVSDRSYTENGIQYKMRIVSYNDRPSDGSIYFKDDVEINRETEYELCRQIGQNCDMYSSAVTSSVIETIFKILETTNSITLLNGKISINVNATETSVSANAQIKDISINGNKYAAAGSAVLRLQNGEPQSISIKASAYSTGLIGDHTASFTLYGGAAGKPTASLYIDNFILDI